MSPSGGAQWLGRFGDGSSDRGGAGLHGRARRDQPTLLTILVVVSAYASGTACAGGSTAGFAYVDFSSVAGLSLVGSAIVSNGVLRLTPAQRAAAGAVGHTAKQNIAPGFTVTLDFRVTAAAGIADCAGASGGDGLALVVQGTPTGIGGGGGGIGYLGIQRSLAVELDTWCNSENADPNGNHVSVQSRGVEGNTAHHSASLGASVNVPNLSDGAVHRLTVTYVPGSLKLFLDSAFEPSVVAEVDIASLLALDDGAAWLSLTATTGNAYELHEILSWSATMNAADTDGDGVPDDGDNSGVLGDNPCRRDVDIEGPALPIPSGCDDNCRNLPNPDQMVCGSDSDGIACKRPPSVPVTDLSEGGFVSIDIDEKKASNWMRDWTPTATGLPDRPIPLAPLRYELIMVKAGAAGSSFERSPTVNACGDISTVGTRRRGDVYVSPLQLPNANRQAAFSLPKSLPRDASYWWTVRAQDNDGRKSLGGFKRAYVVSQEPKTGPRFVPGGTSYPVLATSLRTWMNANLGECHEDFDGTHVDDDIVFWDYKVICRFERLLSTPVREETRLRRRAWDTRRPDPEKRSWTRCTHGYCSGQEDVHELKKSVADCKIPPDASFWDEMQALGNVLVSGGACGVQVYNCFRNYSCEPCATSPAPDCCSVLWDILSYDRAESGELEWCY